MTDVFYTTFYSHVNAHSIPRKILWGILKNLPVLPSIIQLELPNSTLQLFRMLYAALICDTAAGILLSPPTRITSPYTDAGGSGS